MEGNLDTCVVIPAYNEASVVGDVVASLTPSFANIVCVDDGSSDATASTARRAGAVVLQHVHNLGQGAALQTGLTYARAHPFRYAITFDADGQHRASDALAMLECARRTRVDAVLGSRFLTREGQHGVPGRRRLILRVATVLTRASTGLAVTDTHNGLRVFSRRAFAALQLTLNGMAHASQLLDQIGELGLTWVEHPVTIAYTDYSVKKGQSNINAINVSLDLLGHRLVSPRRGRSVA